MTKENVYTSISKDGGPGKDINIVSKRKVKPNPETAALLKEKFDRIEASRLEKEKSNNSSGPSVKVRRRDVKKILFITHFNAFLYAACFFIQTGALPYLAKKLEADPVTFGTLQTAFSVCQLLGGPIYGRIGDLFGEKTALIIALASTTATYVVTGLSYSLPVLFLSRVFSVFMHVMQGSQMIATTLSDQENRAQALARLGFSYGLGMVVGPSLGGLITKHYGEQNAALFSACGTLVGLTIVIVFIPQFNKEKKDAEAGIFDLKKIMSLVFLPGVRGVLLVKLLCGVPLGVLQSMFSVIAMDVFGLAADQNGYLMSYIGVLSLIMQGFGVGLITSRMSDLSVVKFSALTLALAFYALGFLTGLTDFLLLLAPLVFSITLLNSVLSSTITKQVPSSDTGTMLGINMAINSIIRTLAPTVGGFLLHSYGFSSIGFLGAFCNTVNLILTRYIEF
eukprot:TRINITY_DN602_c2_g1_i2.p1 TRINITY_DN602_c2_g1~~TRINITY_DN602_c2_g1_i2.p1  ORF type:complete len:451 (+),score=52.78 TRINITY_DN602_c2_g1_i2:27-1379(+)